mmetsp:Transcript_17871/g.23131  ORF Transcript_17871/g.23131 Transcript_17871/m.23131 type:complete len:282 (+) Transcript_17871:191-1036(+)
MPSILRKHLHHRRNHPDAPSEPAAASTAPTTPTPNHHRFIRLSDAMTNPPIKAAPVIVEEDSDDGQTVASTVYSGLSGSVMRHSDEGFAAVPSSSLEHNLFSRWFQQQQPSSHALQDDASVASVKSTRSMYSTASTNVSGASSGVLSRKNLVFEARRVKLEYEMRQAQDLSCQRQEQEPQSKQARVPIVVTNDVSRAVSSDQGSALCTLLNIYGCGRETFGESARYVSCEEYIARKQEALEMVRELVRENDVEKFEIAEDVLDDIPAEPTLPKFREDFFSR